MPGHRYIQVAERLIRHTHILSRGLRHHFLVGQVLSLLVFPFENELAYLWQRLFGIGIDDVIRLSGPDGLLV